VREQLAAIAGRRAVLRAEIEGNSRQLRGLGVEATAARGKPHLRALHANRQQRISELSDETNELRARLAAEEVLSASLEDYAGQLRSGETEPARAHIQRAQRPASETRLRVSRLAEAWAAASVGVMLIVFVLLLVYERGEFLVFALAGSIGLFLFVEAGFRGRLTNLVTSATLGLAVVSALILTYNFFWQIVVTAVIALGVYVLWDNLRELWR
jgi:hypothetical protein